ncbi:MAG: hypothetical protein QF479_05480 [Candidatus Poseidoniaceae archaeon]|jgi:hypothetical protein|nr:hypothetical protein [Candidatus Poseidoniaceae archaeon]HJM87930.1 hypothetical protein [Candidatus Thalassarchaeaceae archaeon]
MVSELPDDVLSNEPVMPEILIKPNKSIPITIAVFLIIGSLMVGFSSYGNLSNKGMPDDEAQNLADSLNTQGSNLTGEQVNAYFDELADAGYFSTLGIIEAMACIALLASGVLLIIGKKLGVWMGIGGGGLYLLDAIVGFVILSGVESPDNLLTMSMRIASGIGMGCGLLCLALPFVPLLVASGRAALE